MSPRQPGRLAALLSEAPPLVPQADLNETVRALGVVSSLHALLVARLLEAASTQGAGRQDTERLLRMREVASRLSLPEHTARDLGRDGRLPVVRIGKAVRVRERDLDRFIRE
jgi:excisionase family DNA binding protein